LRSNKDRKALPIFSKEELKLNSELGKHEKQMEKVFDNDFLTVSLAKRRSSSATSSELSCSSDERS
jgi:hypothetical protein